MGLGHWLMRSSGFYTVLRGRLSPRRLPQRVELPALLEGKLSVHITGNSSSRAGRLTPRVSVQGGEKGGVCGRECVRHSAKVVSVSPDTPSCTCFSQGRLQSCF